MKLDINSSIKRPIILLALLLLSLACGKSEKKPLIGEWSWILREGGFAGVSETPESTGKERSITFEKKAFQTYLNGEEKSSFNYEVEKGVETNFGIRDVIKVDEEIKFLFSFKGDTLILSEPYADGFTDSYVKQ